VARTKRPKDEWPDLGTEVMVIDGQLVMATPVGGPIPFQVGLDIWERQPDESDKDWAYFSHYRDMAAFDRTIKQVYLHFFPTPAIADCTGRPVYHWLQDIALRFRWKERAASHDRHQDEFFRSALLAERVKVRKETAILGSDMRRKAAGALRYVQTTLEYEIIDPATGEMHKETKTVLSIKEILALAKVGSGLERDALDMQSEAIVAQQLHLHIKDDDNQLLDAAQELLNARANLIDVTPTKGGVSEE